MRLKAAVEMFQSHDDSNGCGPDFAFQVYPLRDRELDAHQCPARASAQYQFERSMGAPPQQLSKGSQLMRNVGSIDRIVRVVAGLLLIAFAVPVGFPQTGWNWVGWIGVVPALTGAFAYCPAYTLFGMSTCSAKQA
jgi:hypothetical protein